MSELEELKKLKKEIEAKIRAEQKKLYKYGVASIAKKKFDGCNYWVLQITSKNIGEKINTEQDRAVIYGREKDDVVINIQKVIDDLQGLLDKLKGDKE